MKRLVLLPSLLLALLLAPLAMAVSPEGLWRTIDDETGEARSIVKIWQQDGEYQGQIQQLLNATATVCDQCTGEFKNQPIEGMVFLWGMKPKGKGWEGGKILDPGNGKVYKSKMKMLDEGELLEVRGFIGFSLIGRSQIWHRVK